MKETAIHQKFRSRIDYLRQHVELVSLSLTEAGKTFDEAIKADPSATITGALGLPAGKYKKLSSLPAKTQQNFVKHSQNRTNENALQLLYAHLEEYAYEVASKLPVRLNAYNAEDALKGRSITAEELFHAHQDGESLDKLLAGVIKKQIQECESGRKTLEQIERRVAMGKIDQRKKSNMLFVMDIRNCLVHDAGKSTAALIEKWGKNLNKHLGIENPGKALKLDDQFIEKAIEWISEHVYDIDERLIDAGTLPPRPLPKPKAEAA